jgi:DNA polymerase III subunit delta'
MNLTENFNIKIWGQNQILKALQKAYSEDRIMPAYLFWGESDLGKTSTALWLAQLLNCATPKENSPCGSCISCRKIFRLVHPDLSIIAPLEPENRNEEKHNPHKEIHIEQIRDFQEEAKLLPLEGKRKVCIIKEAHKLNDFSANCLLKILEEPPAALTIIITADSPAHLIPTIVSRCNPMKFSLLTENEMQAFLQNHLESPAKIPLYLNLAQGKPGKALTLLENPEFEENREKILKILCLLHRKSLSETIEETDKLELENPENMEIVLSWTRDLILFKENLDLKYLINQDFKTELMQLAQNLTLWQCYQIGLTLKETLQDLEKPLNLNKKFIILRMLTSLNEFLESKEI